MTWLINGHHEGAALAHRYGEHSAADTVRIKRQPLPGGDRETNKMPGHWLLARLGKRVLRPGGLELTHRLIEHLDIQPSDSVVEFAPGLGVTARLALNRNPSSYTAVERDETAAGNLRCLLAEPHQRCVCGSADQTGLPSGTASVVYGEAMLTMQGPAQKARIIREAFRLLHPGGRYGIHELCFTPDDLDDRVKDEVQARLTESIRVGARPLTVAEWRALLEAEGFEVRQESLAPMHLLEPGRLLRDEGLLGTGRFIWKVLRDSDARRRVRSMRAVFKKYEVHMAAIMLVACKAPAPSLSPELP
jgi:ubiquinone/menaquinone biosynthesis C-methylase UbiE